jgi:hypothetical protein
MIRLGLNDAITTDEIASSPLVALALSQTIAWCELPQTQQSDFRSPQLDPSDGLARSKQLIEPIDAWVKARYEAYEKAITQLVQRRASLLQLMNVPMPHDTDAPSKGRLLEYFPLETVTCGASEASSRGFFDIDDAPPWDTWFCWVETRILCWIPSTMFNRVEAGIWANPVDCIHWAKGRDLSHLTN